MLNKQRIIEICEFVPQEVWMKKIKDDTEIYRFCYTGGKIMDKNELTQYKYIKIINNLSGIIEKDKNLITLFSEFISNNKDFRYNKTYLTDQIQDFTKCVENFNKKRDKIQEFNSNLKNKYKSLKDWVIILDNVFIIDSDFKVKLLVDKIAELNKLKKISIDENHKIKIQGDIINLSQYVSEFKLFNIDENKIFIRYLNIISNKDYVKIYNTYEEIKLLSLVKKEFELKEEAKVDSNARYN